MGPDRVRPSGLLEYSEAVKTDPNTPATDSEAPPAESQHTPTKAERIEELMLIGSLDASGIRAKLLIAATLVLCLALVTSCAPGAVSGFSSGSTATSYSRGLPGCEWWGTRVFFQDNSVEGVRACLAAGANVNYRDESGFTPLHSAAWLNPDPAVIVALVRAGADVNARDWRGPVNDATPLHWAVLDDPDIDDFSANPAIIRTLVAAGARVNARDSQGWTPLHWAAYRASPAIVRALLDVGADASARAYGSNAAPWHLAQENNALIGTDVYWRLYEGRF